MRMQADSRGDAKALCKCREPVSRRETSYMCDGASRFRHKAAEPSASRAPARTRPVRDPVCAGCESDGGAEGDLSGLAQPQAAPPVPEAERTPWWLEVWRVVEGAERPDYCE